MDYKKMLIGFITVFAITLLVTAGISFLWNWAFHGLALIDWETSFRFAIILGIVLSIIESRRRMKSEN